MSEQWTGGERSTIRVVHGVQTAMHFAWQAHTIDLMADGTVRLDGQATTDAERIGDAFKRWTAYMAEHGGHGWPVGGPYPAAMLGGSVTP